MQWTYADLMDLPFGVYEILIEELNREYAAQKKAE